MNEQHYQEKLSEFVNHELANDERQRVAEHLLRCAGCRAEHDDIKFAAAASAAALGQADAPEQVWSRIENSLNEKKKKISVFPASVFFGRRALTAAAAFLIVGGLAVAIYFGLVRSGSPEIVKTGTPAPQTANIALPPAASEASRKTNPPIATPAADSTAGKNAPLVDAPPVRPRIADPGLGRAPSSTPPVRPENVAPGRPNSRSWEVETLAGTPNVGGSFAREKLAVGEFLETDANSRARVQVADIGNVEIAPNSRVRLVNTRSTEHRLALEKGALKAKILAPPRLFIVDTPAAAAVDLGCEYTLEVDGEGNGKLHVTGGFVALERDGRESIVPAGAIALTKKGKGVGTPFAEDASPVLRDALYRFDFDEGGSAALQTIIGESGLDDSITLWHLLARVAAADRGKVFDALAAQVKPPARVTRDGVSKLNKMMLDAWWTEIENVWFE